MADASYPDLRKERERITRDALAEMFADQQFDVLVARRLLGEQWDRRLAERVFALNLATATAVGDRVVKDLPGDYNPAFMHAWLRKNADLAALNINDSTRASLADSEDEDAKTRVFELLVTSGAAQYAASMVTTAANFGAQDAATGAGAKTKTWVSSGGPRHAHMNGETVPMDQDFSNGMAWPGDPDGGAGNVANCGCTVTFN